MGIGHVLDDVLKEHEVVGLLKQRCKAHVDLPLAARGHLMVLCLYFQAALLHGDNHVRPHVLVRVGGRYGEVAFLVAGLVPQIRAFVLPGVPDAFLAVHAVEREVRAFGEAHVVKDEELCLRAEVGGVAKPGGLQVLLGLQGDVSGVLVV